MLLRVGGFYAGQARLRLLRTFQTSRVCQKKHQTAKKTSTELPPVSAFVSALLTKESPSGTELQHFVDNQEKNLLVNVLPQATKAKDGVLSLTRSGKVDDQKEALTRLLGMQTGNAKARMLWNIQLAINEFGRCEEVGVDTGSPEVQGNMVAILSSNDFSFLILAAIWTVKIRNLESHLLLNRKDVHNRRQLRKMIHKRAKILKYLKGKNPVRYSDCLKRLQLRPDDVEGEIVVR